jgi:hypothetical protein
MSGEIFFNKKLWYNITINDGQRQDDNFRVWVLGLLWLGVSMTPYNKFNACFWLFWFSSFSFYFCGFVQSNRHKKEPWAQLCRLEGGGLGPHGFDIGVMRILHDKVLVEVWGGSCTPSPFSRAEEEADGWCANNPLASLRKKIDIPWNQCPNLFFFKNWWKKKKKPLY